MTLKGRSRLTNDDLKADILLLLRILQKGNQRPTVTIRQNHIPIVDMLICLIHDSIFARLDLLLYRLQNVQ